MSATALVGAQFGSEGKGAIAYHLRNNYGVHVRTGAPNAGHTFYHNGQKFVARSVPVGWTNPNASVVIGAGALLDVDLLIEEVEEIAKVDRSIRSRLLVDYRASVITPFQRDFEGGVKGDAHELIGSTGEGVGPARMAKISRGTLARKGEAQPWTKHSPITDYNVLLAAHGIHLHDTVQTLNSWIDIGGKVLLEGTQGCHLSLTHGEWPYVTSTDTNAASLAADAGISPSMVKGTVLVARTYPIRVAGNSGKLRGETSFEELGVEPERTTVTKKIRRIGEWDHQLFDRAVMLNRPVQVALTFADYIDPEIAGKTDLTPPVEKWIRENTDSDVWVRWVGTGPTTIINLA